MNDLIYLNVGGTKYTTTRSTLCKYPDSMLGRMFNVNSQFKQVTDREGNIFLNSNGKIFEYILDFIISGVVPEDEIILNRFKTECDYYQLPYKELIYEEKKELDEIRLDRYNSDNEHFNIILREIRKNNGKNKTLSFNFKDIYNNRNIIQEYAYLKLKSMGYNVIMNDSYLYVKLYN